MTRGPTYYDTKGACIYCESKETLSDEHILPYALGGGHVIRKASCASCAGMTSAFEKKIARDLWGDARTAYNAPTRRKKERKNVIVVPDLTDRNKNTSYPAQEYPAALIFYKMMKAGLLAGLPDTVDLSNAWQLVAIDDHKRRDAFFAKYGKYPAVQFRHVPHDFGRLLTKVGYGQILTSLDPSDFQPICLPYITGEKKNLSFVVGGSLDDQPAEPDNGYSLDTKAFGDSNRLLLIATIRFYANTASPVYHVVVGTVGGTVNVERVLTKLGGVASNGTRDSHWVPAIWPLKSWPIT